MLRSGRNDNSFVSFLYSEIGGIMKIYIDVVFFINFMFDLLLLISVGLERKIVAKLSRLLLGAFLGSLSIFFLFLPLNSLTLFLLKAGVSLLMIATSFGLPNKQYVWNNLKAYMVVVSF